jgi:hypothetical protein
MENIFHVDVFEKKDLLLAISLIFGILIFATLLFFCGR